MGSDAPISTSRVLELHAAALERFSPGSPTGPAGAADCVDGCIGAVANAILYDDVEPSDGLQWAARLCHRLARRHCFTDGNKRIAWAVLADILYNVGLDVDATDAEVYALVSDVATDRMSEQELVDWLLLEGRLVPADFVGGAA